MGDYKAYRVHANGMNPMSYKQMWIELGKRPIVYPPLPPLSPPLPPIKVSGSTVLEDDLTQKRHNNGGLPPGRPPPKPPSIINRLSNLGLLNILLFIGSFSCVITIAWILVTDAIITNNNAANHSIDLPTYAMLNTRLPYSTNQIAVLELPTSTMFLTMTSMPTETSRPSATRVFLPDTKPSLPVYTQPPLLTFQAMQQSASIYVLAQSIIVRPKPGDHNHLAAEIQQGTVLLINGYNLLPSEQVIWWKVEYSSGKFGWVVDNRQLFQLQNVKFDSAGTPIGVKNIAKP